MNALECKQNVRKDEGEGSAYCTVLRHRHRLDQMLIREREKAKGGRKGGRERRKDEGKGERMKGKAKG